MSATEWFVKYNKVLDIAGRTSPSRPERPEDRIKVAILDTGVDTSHDKLKPFWRRQQIIYQDFVGPGPGIPQDEHGHGTHVTSILLDVVKNANVYVGRITKDGKTFNSERVEKVSFPPFLPFPPVIPTYCAYLPSPENPNSHPYGTRQSTGPSPPKRSTSSPSPSASPT